jgi:hypothetical protein
MAVHGTRQRSSVSWNYAGLVKLLTGLARERTGLPVLRCYWYEAPVEGRFIAEHDTLADIPGLKLRLARMRPGRQDGVEAEMHRDLTTLARNGSVADAVIASSHEDLAGVVAEVQDLGMRVMLVHITADGSWTVSRPLRQECDDIIDISGAHLRPFVDLISGAEPAGHDRQYANGSYQHQSLTNGRAASVAAVTHQAPAALPAPSSLAFYNPPQTPEYQPAASQQQGNEPARQNSGRDPGQPAPALPAPQNPAQQAPMPQATGQQPTSQAALGQQPAGPQSPGPQPPSQQAQIQQPHVQQAPAQQPHVQQTQVQHAPVQQALAQAPQAYTAMAPAPVAPAVQQPAPGNTGQVAQPVSVPTAAGLGAAPPAQAAPSSHQGAQPSGSGQGTGRNAYRPQDGAPDPGRQGGQAAYAAAPVQQQAPQPQSPHSMAPQQPGTPMPGPDAPRLVGPGSPYAEASESPRLAEQAARFAEPRFAESRFAEPPARYLDAQAPTRYVESPGHTGFPEGQAQSRFADGPGHTGFPESQAQNRFGDSPAQSRFADATGQVQYPPAQLPGYSQSQREQAPYGGQQSVPAPVPQQAMGVSLAEAVQAAHAEGFGFGDAVARDAPALWLEAVLARKPRMPSDLEARLMQGSALPIDSLLHDEVRHSLRRGFWDALERSRR